MSAPGSGGPAWSSRAADAASPRGAPAKPVLVVVPTGLGGALLGRLREEGLVPAVVVLTAATHAAVQDHAENGRVDVAS